MKNPKDLYLWKNINGAYYFRRRLPESLRAILGKTEIKVSLQTDSCKEARKLASIYSAEIQILTMGDKKALPSLQEILFNTFPEARKLKESADNLPELLLPKNLRQTLGAEEPEPPATPQPKPIQTFTHQQPAPQTEPSELLSEVIDAYFKEADLTGRWKKRGADQVREACNLFIEMVGDRPINEITKQLARQFKQDYMRLPANKSKKPEYRDKSVAELLTMSIPDSDKLKPETVNNNLTRISTFFNWAVDNDYLEKNPFKGLLLGKSSKGERDAFRQEDLVKLFESSKYINNDFKYPYEYWCPLIALYSGMRCEELARIQTDSFNQIGDIWCIQNQKGDDGWDGKRGSGIRIIPIHQKLIELGLLSFVDKVKTSEGLRLFPELTPIGEGVEYGIKLSRWFSRYRKSCDITEKSKTLHSFRHTLLNKLKQSGVPLGMAQAIAGHEGQSLTYGHYGKDYELSIAKEAIDKVDFGLSHFKHY